MDANAFGAEMVALVRDFLEQEIDPLREQVAALQEQLRAIPAPKEYDVEGTARVVIDEDVLPRLKEIEGVIEARVAELKAIPPVEPKEVDMEAVRQAVAEDVQKMVDAAVAALPPAEPGKNADPEHVATLIKETAEAILSTWDRPEDGKSVTVADVQPMVAELVDKAVAAIPVPKDGADVSGGTIDRNGHLVVTLTNGQTKDFGLVVGRDGIDADMQAVERRIKDMFDAWPKPKDGADGVGFDDMTFETREDGCYLVWEKGDIVKEARLPIPMDRGVYKEGGAYHGGDGVTWGGNYYIATENTSAKPDTSKDGKPWRLAVRRGRDGKDAPTKPEKHKDKA
jgi:hypothetical protein